MHKMSTRDYAMHTVHDLWSYNISKQPRSMIIPAAGRSGEMPNDSSDPPLSDSGGSSPDLSTIMMEHKIDYTTERTNIGKGHRGRGCLARRACQMKADENCRKGAVTTCCRHRKCQRKHNPARNGKGAFSGLHICSNPACQLKHWKEMYDIEVANASNNS